MLVVAAPREVGWERKVCVLYPFSVWSLLKVMSLFGASWLWKAG